MVPDEHRWHSIHKCGRLQKRLSLEHLYSPILAILGTGGALMSLLYHAKWLTFNKHWAEITISGLVKNNREKPHNQLYFRSQC